LQWIDPVPQVIADHKIAHRFPYWQVIDESSDTVNGKKRTTYELERSEVIGTVDPNVWCGIDHHTFPLSISDNGEISVGPAQTYCQE